MVENNLTPSAHFWMYCRLKLAKHITEIIKQRISIKLYIVLNPLFLFNFTFIFERNLECI